MPSRVSAPALPHSVSSSSLVACTERQWPGVWMAPARRVKTRAPGINKAGGAAKLPLAGAWMSSSRAGRSVLVVANESSDPHAPQWPKQRFRGWCPCRSPRCVTSCSGATSSTVAVALVQVPQAEQSSVVVSSERSCMLSFAVRTYSASSSDASSKPRWWAFAADTMRLMLWCCSVGEMSMPRRWPTSSRSPLSTLSAERSIRAA
jgi:hypothetical protein